MDDALSWQLKNAWARSVNYRTSDDNVTNVDGKFIIMELSATRIFRKCLLRSCELRAASILIGSVKRLQSLYSVDSFAINKILSFILYNARRLSNNRKHDYVHKGTLSVAERFNSNADG